MATYCIVLDPNENWDDAPRNHLKTRSAADERFDEFPRLDATSQFGDGKITKESNPFASLRQIAERVAEGTLMVQSKLIPCYVCRRQIADNAETCPKCGAIQTKEGREKSRRNQSQFQVAFIVLATVFIFGPVLCCFGLLTTIPRQSTTPSPRGGPATWDKEKLRQDSEEVARDPSKTIFIPSDGSQPRVVPNAAYND